MTESEQQVNVVLKAVGTAIGILLIAAMFLGSCYLVALVIKGLMSL